MSWLIQLRVYIFGHLLYKFYTEAVRHERGDFKYREVKTGFCRIRSMQTSSSGTLVGWNLVKPHLSLYGTEWRERGIWTQEEYNTSPQFLPRHINNYQIHEMVKQRNCVLFRNVQSPRFYVTFKIYLSSHISLIPSHITYYCISIETRIINNGITKINKDERGRLTCSSSGSRTHHRVRFSSTITKILRTCLL